MGHKWVPVFAPDVIGLTTGQPLNTVTHNSDRDRKTESAEVNEVG